MIRDSFRMISVGDLRNRLMTLADQSIKGNPDIYNLFSKLVEVRGVVKPVVNHFLHLIL